MEFREMRRGRQQLTEKESIEILKRNTSGTLAVSGDNGYPYAVPLSYVYYDNALYFHCAKSGHKLDALKNCDKASFCVIDQDDILPQKYTTLFRSVIVFGRSKIMENNNEILEAIKKLALKYAPYNGDDALNAEIQKGLPAMHMVKIEIEHMSGKQCIEFVKE
ncbi:MAG: 5-nitroimidazole antibiotic resistance protein [Clostridia bacterium]|nr:5-nitroimidazole antibiotic resistance protein [Clostridia bacterium]